MYPHLITNRAITVDFNGESRSVQAESPKYDNVLDAIRESRWEDVETLMTPEAEIQAASNGSMRVENGQVYVTGDDGQEFTVASDLNDTILSYMENQLPFDGLVKFAIKLNQNPSFRSVQQLFNFIRNTNMTITEDGNFIAYKSVNEDFTDCYTGKFDNSIGKVVSMPRNQVDENPNETCSKGLHVATYDYAHNIYSGHVTLFVEVNPKDVVAVPVDYNNAKMRVCEYRVLGVSEKELDSPIANTKDFDWYDEDDESDEEYDDEEWCEECEDYVKYCTCGSCSDEDEFPF